jgi:hypothetical protein
MILVTRHASLAVPEGKVMGKVMGNPDDVISRAGHEAELHGGGLQANPRPAQMEPFPERPAPSPFPEPEGAAEADPIRAMCDILCDKSVDDDDKYAALTTLADALFPDKPIFRDITDASAWPPSPEEIDAVVAAFHQAANNCMSDEGAEPFQAARACIEWVLGRSSTGYIPHFVSSIIVDVTGVMPGEE